MKTALSNDNEKYSQHLAFPSYQDYQLNRLMPAIKIMLILGIIFILLFSFFDIKDYPQFTKKIIIVRFYTALPLIVILIATQIKLLRRKIPAIFLVFGITSLVIYVYLHTFLNDKMYFISLAFIYYLLGIVSLAPLYSKKQIIIVFIITLALVDIVLLYFSIEYRSYLSKLILKSIGAHFFAIILALKMRDTHKESYYYAFLAHQQSLIDSLTHIFNRKGFEVWIQENLESEPNNPSSISIIMLDIDDFKKVNDQYGHQTGDLVIKTTAKIIASLVDEKDCTARFGGEEFVVLLRNITSKQCFRLAEKIRKTITSRIYSTDESIEFNITISVGISTQSDEKTTLHELIGVADKNLYIAKSKGKNRVIGY